MSDAESIHAAVASMLAQTGNAIDAVVHNAGVAVAGALEDLPQSEIRRVHGDEFLRRAGTDARLAADFSRARSAAASSSSQARRVSSASPRTRSIAPRNGRWRGGPNPWPTNSMPSASTSSWSSPALTGRKSGEARLRLTPEGSAYLPWLRQVFRGADQHEASKARDPIEVAVTIADALEAPRPRFRYPVGFFARLDHFLRGKIPTRLIRRGTKRYLGLPLTR